MHKRNMELPNGKRISEYQICRAKEIERMKIEVKVSVVTTEELNAIVKELTKIEEEYRCDCTLLITIN